MVLRDLYLAYASNESTAKKVTAEVGRFVRFAQASGVEFVDELDTEVVECFLWSASNRYGRYGDVSATTAANRQSFLRSFFEVMTRLGFWTGADVVGRPIRRSVGDRSRPLTESELHQVHVYAESGLFTTGRPLLVALAESGGNAAEIARVTAADVDLDGRTVALRGDAARRTPMSEWGAEVLAAAMTAGQFAAVGPLCVTNTLPIGAAAHTVTVRLAGVIADAGLSRVRGVTARSIRLAVAVQILGSQGLESAARFLGSSSLDATAAALDHQWWDQ